MRAPRRGNPPIETARCAANPAGSAADVGQAHSLMLKHIRPSVSRVPSASSLCMMLSRRRPSGSPPTGTVRASAHSRFDYLGAAEVDALWIRPGSTATLHRARAPSMLRDAADAALMNKELALAGDSQVGLVLRVLTGVQSDPPDVEDAGVGKLLAVTMRDDQDFPTRGVHASAWRSYRR